VLPTVVVTADEYPSAASRASRIALIAVTFGLSAKRCFISRYAA